MLRLDADAPKPPTYPFKSKFSKSADTKQAARCHQRRFPPCLQSFFATASAATSAFFVRPSGVASSSVRRYLRIRPGGRKWKMTGRWRFFRQPKIYWAFWPSLRRKTLGLPPCPA